jgi:hypothetical protein
MRRRIVLAAALGTCVLLLAVSPVSLPHGDFDEYWAAGRLNAAGSNPYDPDAMLREQRQAGWQQSRPVMMYNPPWTLALAMPLGWLDIQLAHGLWLIAQVLICLWCASRLWALYAGAPRHEVRIWCLALLWMPTVAAVRMGQISPLVLLGLVGFVCSLEKGRDTIAGLFFALSAVKPQLVAVIWVAWILWVVHQRRWKVVLGTATALAAAALIPILTNPAVFGQYRHLMASAPPTLEFESPNIATLMRVVMTAALGTGTWPQFVPTAIGIAIVAWLWRRRYQMWSWTEQLPWLVTLSCLTTSYGGWTFDLLILLVPVIATAAAVARTRNGTLLAVAAGVFVAVSLGAVAMLVVGAPEATYLWVTPVVAVCGVGFERYAGTTETADFLAPARAHS